MKKEDKKEELQWLEAIGCFVISLLFAFFVFIISAVLVGEWISLVISVINN